MSEIGLLLEKLRTGGCWERKGHIADLITYPEGSYTATVEEWLRSGSDALLRNIAMETYRALGCRAHASLISLLREGDADVRVLAASLLGDIGDGGAVSRLIEALNDDEVNVRVAAAEALGKTGGELAICALADLLNGTPWEAMAAIEAYGSIGGERALQVLNQCMEWEDYRVITCSALGRAGNRETLRHLESCTAAGCMEEPLLKAMVQIAEREGVRLSSEFLSPLVPFLMELQLSPIDEVRTSAFVALSWSEDSRGIPYFIAALDDAELQEHAVQGLVSLGERAVCDLVEALRKPLANRVIVAKVISMAGGASSLLPFASDEDPGVRTEVALALGPLRTPEAGNALCALRDDSDKEVRAAAKNAMEKFREGSVLL